MYDEAAEYYDLLYENKNYEREADYLGKIVAKKGSKRGLDALDVACGTGVHLAHFRKHYRVEGLDMSKKLVRIAKRKKKIVRMSTSLRKGKISCFDLHHLIGTPHGTRHIVEHHEMALFTDREMKAAFTHNGLKVEYDPVDAQTLSAVGDDEFLSA